ncbi:hypothetical protein GEMRC1_003592 [Eukaryota sp. GEM-RC1]
MDISLEECRTGITSTLFTGNVFVVIGTLVCSLFSAAIGANDVANSVGTSIGSGVVTMRQGILIAFVFEFLGAFF